MQRPIPTNKHERELARLARQAAAGRDVLFHGTRHAKSILTTGVLLYSISGIQAVFFTRSPETAAYFALSERDDDEGQGAILVLDRQSLRCRYRIEPWHDGLWNDETDYNDEMEERIWESVTDVGHHLIGLITEPTTQYSLQTKALNRTRRRQIKARLTGIEPDKVGELLGILHSLEGNQ